MGSAENEKGCAPVTPARYAQLTVGLLERGAIAHPGRTAVVDEWGSVTYAGLFERAQRLASGLLDRGLGGRATVVVAEKSADALVAFFGTLMAGGFYAPVAPDAPAGRAGGVWRRLDGPVVIAHEATSRSARELFPLADVLLVEELVASDVNEPALERAAREAVSTDPAYVLFTSGSTGEPKGVAVSHLAVLDFIGSFVSTFGIGPDDVLGNQAPLDFDVSVKDVYGALAAGACVALLPRRLFSSPAELVERIVEWRVTVLVWAVAALCLVSGLNALDHVVPSRVRLVLFSGEVMPLEHLRRWMGCLPGATFANLYGPTEITCNCLFHVVERGRTYPEGIPLGAPFPNRRVLLLDEEGRQVTRRGGVGEICVGGPSVALGYYADPERTSRSFVRSPLDSALPVTLYRTGDLARIGDDGELYFCGRRDNQVKHLGHRIELEEIDAAFERQAGVERCRCAYDVERHRICAFFEGTADPGALREAVAALLPGAVVPTRIERVDGMPLTKNGKVDRRALLRGLVGQRGRRGQMGGSHA